MTLLKSIRSFWKRYDIDANGEHKGFETTISFDACDREKVSSDLAKHIKKMMKLKTLPFVALLLCSGCKIPKGDILSITQSSIGIHVGQNPQTGSPQLDIGLRRTTFQLVPTSTNQIYAPLVNSSLSLDQKAFTTAIDEDFQTGGAVAPPDSVAKKGAAMRMRLPK